MIEMLGVGDSDSLGRREASAAGTATTRRLRGDDNMDAMTTLQKKTLKSTLGVYRRGDRKIVTKICDCMHLIRGPCSRRFELISLGEEGRGSIVDVVRLSRERERGMPSRLSCYAALLFIVPRSHAFHAAWSAGFRAVFGRSAHATVTSFSSSGSMPVEDAADASALPASFATPT